MKLRKAISKQIKADNKKAKISKLKNKINEFKEKHRTKTIEEQIYQYNLKNTKYITEEEVLGTLIYHNHIPGGHVVVPSGIIRTSDTFILKFNVNGEIIETRSTDIYKKCNKQIGSVYKLLVRTRYLKDGKVRQGIKDIIQRYI